MNCTLCIYAVHHKGASQIAYSCTILWRFVVTVWVVCVMMHLTEKCEMLDMLLWIEGIQLWPETNNAISFSTY